VWNHFNFRKRDSVKLVMDISETFSAKWEAFNKHKSQFMVMLTIGWFIWLKDRLKGIRYGFKYAEEFYKIQ
jgi:LmbE family N-acetylglucosaminyl deacetylase